MALLNITFKHTNCSKDSRLDDYLAEKLASLEKYVGGETDVKIDVEFEKVAPHQSGPVFRVEVNFWLAGNLYRGESTKDTFEAAADEVKNELDQEMRRATTKRTSLFRRGSRKIKEMMRFGK